MVYRPYRTELNYCASFNFNCSGVINKIVPCDDDLTATV